MTRPKLDPETLRWVAAEMNALPYSEDEFPLHKLRTVADFQKRLERTAAEAEATP